MGIVLCLVSALLSQSIQVTQPAPGKVYLPGEEIRIQWRAMGISGQFGIALVRTDQQKRYTIGLNIARGHQTFSYKIPNNIEIGKYYIVVGSAETAAMSAIFTIQKGRSQSFLRAKAVPPPPRPDLIIEHVEISDRNDPTDKILSRDELHFLVTVKNIGNKYSESEFYVGFSHWGCDTQRWEWQEVMLDSLDVGKTTLIILEVRGHDLPNGWKENPRVCIKVDARNQVLESNEGNNTNSLDLHVYD